MKLEIPVYDLNRKLRQLKQHLAHRQAHRFQEYKRRLFHITVNLLAL